MKVHLWYFSDMFFMNEVTYDNCLIYRVIQSAMAIIL
jgi:hypothetical protein